MRPPGHVCPICESEEEQFASAVQEIFWMLDAETKKVIYVSSAYERICGRTCASLYEAPLSYREAIHPGDQVRVLSRLNELARGGKFDKQFRITHPDGSMRWV
jgi:PAS domain S-box-containing protein